MEKPPLGLRPEWIVNGDRAKEIMEAIVWYIDSSKPIPIEWVSELQNCLTKVNNRLVKIPTHSECDHKWRYIYSYRKHLFSCSVCHEFKEKHANN